MYNDFKIIYFPYISLLAGALVSFKNLLLFRFGVALSPGYLCLVLQHVSQ